RRPHGRFSDLCSGCGAHESTGPGGQSESPARTTVGTETSALLTDLYELTMLRAARDACLDSRRRVFDVFTRALPAGLRYGASAGSRMVTAARGRPCIEMGGRRVHEDAAIAAARAAYVVGFDSSSNLAAGAHYRVPVAGTAAHAFTLLFDSEEEAFRAQLASQ